MRVVIMLLAFVLFAPALALADGVIAINDEEGVSASKVGYGIGHGATDKLASTAALEACTKNNPDGGCEVKIHYARNKCGAYATSSKIQGTGTGTTREDAITAALGQCGTNCQLVVADCDPGQ